GLVQTVSVYIDTILLCTATALMCLCSGVSHSADVAGPAYVQNAISTVFGSVGPIFITVAMVLFAFTTLLGNLYYVTNALIYLNKKKTPSEKFMLGFRIVCIAVIFLGTLMPMDLAWTAADITMGGMTLINIPCCFLLSKHAIAALKDYEKQKKAGQNPVFRAKDIGLDPADLSFWK
ncbi:MAG: alanine:cation symporter family protein, partial [Oscillospiraceae bacterium]|nr:alanine:cation symporter family protein [Oscillospiraceae bacterium]